MDDHERHACGIEQAAGSATLGIDEPLSELGLPPTGVRCVARKRDPGHADGEDKAQSGGYGPRH